MYFAPVDSGLYQFRVTIDGTVYSAVGTFTAGSENVIGLGSGYVGGTLYHLSLAIKPEKTLAIYGYQADNGIGAEWTSYSIMFREI